ncbi:hypothetical protein CPLU01_07704 [Colletotrichum plurivorum]|uniref:Uncharacterized protein n=1 Tax=Colletotrichum plurivorum TaxID=2175906 RepID=A0A8H6KF77_9PEZI|nr:hypothetical protein CPLU01_07704 [Colletotrichum plurivorum]
MELAAMSPVFFWMFTDSSAARRRQRTTTDQSLMYPECFEPFRLGCLAKAFLQDVKDIFTLFANDMKALGVTTNHFACAVAAVLVIMYLALWAREAIQRAHYRRYRKKRGHVELRLFGDDDERPTEGQMEAAHVLAFLALVYFCVRPEGRDWFAVLLVGVQAGYLAMIWRARVARRLARLEGVVRPIVRKHLPVSYKITWREEGGIIVRFQAYEAELRHCITWKALRITMEGVSFLHTPGLRRYIGPRKASKR